MVSAPGGVMIRADPQFTELVTTIHADGLQQLDLRTNHDADGQPKPFPGGDNIDRALWKDLPLTGARYHGTGPLTLRIEGRDDETEAGNGLTQQVSSWLDVPYLARANFGPQRLDFDNRDLRVRFYGWLVDADGTKRNRDGQALTPAWGSYVHTHNPAGDLDPVPFTPGFIAGPRHDNAIDILPGETIYLVANPDDALLSTIPGGDPKASNERTRWFARYSQSNLWQTDWYFQILLHELEADPLGFNP